MTWARIQNSIVREIRDDIGDAPAAFFHPSPYDLCVEVTDRPEVEVGWTYDPESGEFNEPEPVPPGPEPTYTSEEIDETVAYVKGLRRGLGDD